MTIQMLETLVNPFGDLKSDSPDNVQKIHLEGELLVEKAFNMYLDWHERGLFVEPERYYSKYGKDLDAGISEMSLTPHQIDLLFHKILQVPERDRKTCRKLYHFLSRPLISSAIINGHHSFSLHTGDSCIGELFTSQQYMGVSIYGNAGNGLGQYAEHCAFSVEGNVGDSCGSTVQNCYFHVKGDAGLFFGDCAKYSNYVIDGNAGAGFASSARHSTFTINGNVGKLDWRNPESCTFFVKDENVYRRLKRWATEERGNRVKRQK